MDVPRIDGIHHIKIPVTDLDQSRSWHTSRFAYQLTSKFASRSS